jgi:uncharacterized protein (DUF885 family)
MADTVARFRALAEDTVEDLLRLGPERATDLGDHRFDDRLDDLSESGLAERRRVLARRRDELDSLDTAALDAATLGDGDPGGAAASGATPDGAALGGAALDGAGPRGAVLDRADAVDAEILRAALDRDLFALDRLHEHHWNPLVWLPGDALYLLLARETSPVPDRLRALAGRLAAVPDRLAAARAALGDMPRVHVETAVGQTAGVVALVRDEVPALLARAPGLAGVVEPARAAALRALEEHRAWLAERERTAAGEPRLGAELFAAKLHLELDADLPAERVVDLARERLAVVTEELREVATDWVGAGADPVAEALERCARDAPTDATIVPLARQALAETTELVRRSGIVRVPDEPTEVQVMPEFRRGVAVAYCDAPGPLETGGTTYYAISPTPADWPAERVASFYREYNTAQLVDLTVHEAMPGHVLQLAHARRYRGATRVRQVLASGSFIEGWAVHGEQIMARLGCGGPATRVQQLKMMLRTTINALLDAGVHADGMTEAEALALMTGAGHQEEGEAVGKWRRAQLTSAQLSTYFVGYAELAPVVAGRDRYDEVLAHGSPPPRHLPALTG